jgi:hypothetical protein
MGLVDIRAAGCGHRGGLWWTNGGQLVGRAPGGRCGARHRTPFRSNVPYVACFGGYPRDAYKQWNGAFRHVDGVVSALEVGAGDVAGGLIQRLTLARRIVGRKSAHPPRIRGRDIDKELHSGAPWESSFGTAWDELLGVLGAAFSHAHSSRDW